MVTSITGPFGSYAVLTLTERVLFWTPVMAVTLVIGTLAHAFVKAWLGIHNHMRCAAVSAGLNAVVISPPLYLLLLAMLPQAMVAMLSGPEIVLLVGSTSLGVCALRVSRKVAVPMTPEPQLEAEPLPEEPRLMRRIEPDLRGDLWAMTVRDHYVDVQTSLGKASLLMRLSDAIAEVEGVPGAQVHRSHWVAWAGVSSVGRQGGKMTIHLHNGQMIPVSRNHRDKVEARFPSDPAIRTDAT